MPPPPKDSQTTPGVFEQVATRIAFFVTGLAMASWAPLIPLAQSRIGLDEGQLGGLLLCAGLGSVFTMPFAGGLAGRFGCRTMILIAGALAIAALPLMATASTSIQLAISLLCFGAGIGTIDVTMNIQAVIVEKASGRAMMSGFHGLFSAGGIAGAGAVTGMLALGLTPVTATMAILILSAVLLVGFAKGLLPYGSEQESTPFALPRGSVLLIGAMCFVLFLAEGSVLDWSGVLLNSVHGLEKSRAGLGYVAFAIAMTVGRLTGDMIVSKLGPRKILFLGGLCSAVGFALAALVPSWIVSIVGFALVGIGASNVVPVLFTAAGRQTSMPSNMAVAAVTALGYAGILVGPALIGFVARASSLPVALMMVVALLVGVVLSSRKVAAV